MSVTIRPAQTFDVGFAAPLIQQTIGPIGHTLTGTTSDDEAAHILAQFYPLRGHRLSFTHTLIAEVQGRPAGLAVLYPGEFAVQLDDPYRDFLRSRGLPGELYVDTLAVSEDQRGKGIGAQLLQACLNRAAQQNLPLALLVEENNPALHLYERHGLKCSGQADVAGHHYLRLRQPLTLT